MGVARVAAFGSALLNVVLSANLLGQTSSTLPAASQPSHAGEFAANIEQGLEIKGTGADILPALEQAVAKVDSPPAELAASIGKLTDAMLKGPDPEVILNQLLPRLEIGGSALSDPESAKSWKFGDSGSRDKLFNSMGELANGLQGSDPKRASEIARAALLLAALFDYRSEWRGLVKLDRAKVDMKALTAVSDDDFKQLQQLVRRRIAAVQASLSPELDAFRGMDDISSKGGQPIQEQDVRSVLSNLDKAFGGSPQLGYNYEIIFRTWSFLNLMKSRGYDKGQAMVREQLQAWRAGSTDPNIGRWVSQALTRDGPPPSKLVTEVNIEVDSSGRPLHPETLPFRRP